jgi:transcriptional regulator with XRE-family HTH domain
LPKRKFPLVERNLGFLYNVCISTREDEKGMRFSNNLKRIRAEKNLSQEQLAELLGVSRQAVSKWEQDSGYPETEKLIQIAQQLDVSLDSLLLDRPSEEEARKQLEQKQVVFVQGGSIIIQPYGDTAMSSFFRFSIQKNITFGNKNEPKFALCGVDRTGFWGDNLVLLGWYESMDEAKQELRDIYTAIQNGDATYRLKYYTDVVMKALGPKKIKPKD